jgi:hypothetical protein
MTSIEPGRSHGAPGPCTGETPIAKKKSTKALPDAALILECISYGQAFAAYHGGFRADPDDSSHYAAKLGEEYSTRADEALDNITRLRAASRLGLDAKRRVAEVIMHDSITGRHYSIETDEAQFLLGFVDDVKIYLENERVSDRIAEAA